MFCLHCGVNPAAGESKFCTSTCLEAFAKTMPESISCSGCDQSADGIAEAIAAGWIDIERDPEGSSWNYLGFCPECQREEREEETAP
jgi:hypothetical protein